MTASNGNGDGVERVAVAVLQLSFTPSTFRLEIGGNVVNAEMALAMLDQAKREFETQLRQAAALRLQQQLHQMAQDQAVAAALRKH